MNPPFALSGSLEQEHRFVTQALSQMADGGVLFCLLPMDSMFGAYKEKLWRSVDLLQHNTLLSVVSLPHDLFIPAAKKQVVAIIVKKGIPHPKEQPVFWARIAHDGFILVKTKRLPASELNPPRAELNQIPLVLPSLRNFVANPGTVNVNVPKLC